MIYMSPDGRSSTRIDENFVEKLDFILSKHVDQMNSEEFAQICNSSVSEDGLIMTSALKEGT